MPACLLPADQHLVSVDGREGILIWDGRPTKPYIKLLWVDDGAVSKAIKSSEVAGLAAPNPSTSDPEEDRVTVEGREAVVVWDGRPKFVFVKVRYLDDGSMSRALPLTKVEGLKPVSKGTAVKSEPKSESVARVTVNGREATVEWDGRPKLPCIKVRFVDDGSVSRTIPASKVQGLPPVSPTAVADFEFPPKPPGLARESPPRSLSGLARPTPATSLSGLPRPTAATAQPAPSLPANFDVKAITGGDPKLVAMMEEGYAKLKAVVDSCDGTVAEDCENGYSCLKPDCNRRHALGRELLDNVEHLLCRFDRKCRNVKCFYIHLEGRELDAQPEKANCSFGAACTKPKCVFLHPPERSFVGQERFPFRGGEVRKDAAIKQEDSATEIVVVHLDELDLPELSWEEAQPYEKEVFVTSFPDESALAMWAVMYGDIADTFQIRDLSFGSTHEGGYIRFKEHEAASNCVAAGVAQWSLSERAWSEQLTLSSDGRTAQNLTRRLLADGGELMKRTQQDLGARFLFLGGAGKNLQFNGREYTSSRLHFGARGGPDCLQRLIPTLQTKLEELLQHRPPKRAAPPPLEVRPPKRAAFKREADEPPGDLMTSRLGNPPGESDDDPPGDPPDDDDEPPGDPPDDDDEPPGDPPDDEDEPPGDFEEDEEEAADADPLEDPPGDDDEPPGDPPDDDDEPPGDVSSSRLDLFESI